MNNAGVLLQARHWLEGLSAFEQALGVAALTFVPWIELRGSIPLGIALGLHPLAAMAIAVAANCAIIVPGYYALELFYDRWFSRFAPVRRAVVRVRARGVGFVERYELLGLALFVAVPLPGTGAYSGTLLAWLLGMNRPRAWVAIAVGVTLAGAVVTLAASGVLVALRRLP